MDPTRCDLHAVTDVEAVLASGGRVDDDLVLAVGPLTGCQLHRVELRLVGVDSEAERRVPVAGDDVALLVEDLRLVGVAGVVDDPARRRGDAVHLLDAVEQLG